MLHGTLRNKPGGGQFTEDSLTAIVLGRLAYLPETLAWELLLCAARPAPGETEEPFAQAVFSATKYQGCPFAPEFWPRFPGVEPDVVLRLPDAWLVIEAKAPGLGDRHSPAELQSEFTAVLTWAVSHGAPQGVCVLMIEPPSSYRGWSGAVGAPVRGLRWCEFSDVLSRVLETRPLGRPQRRILEDLVAALDAAQVPPVLSLRDTARGLAPCNKVILL